MYHSRQLLQSIINVIEAAYKLDSAKLTKEVSTCLKNQLQTIPTATVSPPSPRVNNQPTTTTTTTAVTYNLSNHFAYIVFLFTLLDEVTKQTTEDVSSLCCLVQSHFIKYSGEKSDHIDEITSIIANIIVSLNAKSVRGLPQTLLVSVLALQQSQYNDNRTIQRFAIKLTTAVLQPKYIVSLPADFMHDQMSILFTGLKSSNSTIRSHSISCLETILSVNKQWLELMYNAILQLPDQNERLKLFFRFQRLFFEQLTVASKPSTSSTPAPFNLLAKPHLAQVLFHSLLENDNVPRKQSLHLLKTLIALPSSAWQQYLPFNPKQWSLYISLYEAFNETKSHLFKPVWSQLQLLFTSSCNEQQPFARASITDHTKSAFWLTILLRRGFGHVNPNIRRRVIMDVLTTPTLGLSEAMANASSSAAFDQVLAPLFRSIDSPDFCINAALWAAQQQQQQSTPSPSMTRKLELFDCLSSFLATVMAAMKEAQVVSFYERLITFFNRELRDTHCVVMLLEEITQISDGIEVNGTIMEQLRSMLDSHPITNAPANIHLYRKVLYLLTNMEKPATFTAGFRQVTARLLALLPKHLADSEHDRIDKWLHKGGSGSWMMEYLSSNLGNGASGDATQDIELHQAMSRLLRYLTSDDKTKFLAQVLSGGTAAYTVDTLLLVKCIIHENANSFNITDLFTKLTPFIYELVKQFLTDQDTLKNQPQQQQQAIQPTYEQMEKVVEFISLNKTSFIELAQYCQQCLLNHAGANYNSQQTTLMFLIWHLCHSSAIFGQESREFLVQLLQLRPKRDAYSVKQMPLSIEYRWQCILDLMTLSIVGDGVGIDDRDDRDENEEIDTICQLVFECVLDTLDNATSHSLSPLFDSLLLSIVGRYVRLTPTEAAQVHTFNLPLLNQPEMMSRLFQTAYRAFSDCSKKTMPVIASFINLLFHPLFFHCDSTIPLVKEYLRKTLKEWGESVRISCGLLSHCCGVWSSHLETLDTFLAEIIDLCLLSNEDLEQMEQHDQQQAVGQLATSIDDIHQFKMASNHGYIVRWFVSQLNSRSTTPGDEVLSVQFVRKLMLSLLELSMDGELSQREYSQQSRTNKVKCKLWRTLCALTHVDKAFELGADRAESLAHLGVVTEMMWKILEIKNHSNVRYLIQLFIVNILIRTGSEQSMTQLLVDKLMCPNYDYQIAASIIIISASYLYHLINKATASSIQLPNRSTDRTTPLLPQVHSLFRAIIPWCTDHHHAVRTCSQLAIHSIISRKYQVLGELNNDPLLKQFYHYMDTNTQLKKVRERQSLFVQNDEPLKNSLPANIYVMSKEDTAAMVDNDDEDGAQAARDGDDADGDDDMQQGLALDESVIPMSLLDVSKRLIKDFQSQFQAKQAANPSASSTVVSDAANSDPSLLDFQKRIVPWEQIAQLEALLDTTSGNSAGHSNTGSGNSSTNRAPRQEMIVVGTFIENTPNIAGLIRTSEIFNVTEVAIPNIKLLQDPQFQRVSVAADKWVPISEVNRANLAAYIKAKKEQGYVILGVEQTSQSKNLATFVFPKKCLLLLGQEQNGIPAEFLDLVEYCIEIPQYGVTRSLNVHVSASIVIWEYSQQQHASVKALSPPPSAATVTVSSKQK
ncbi:hypothetical protein SAMD00019534_018290 [Acytostelium subglobosum LB1]|uniref:hypothetical protein n=1 Tax=Acytostelium subglobosum LB1 TaxID=1410327 RepID=UPI0006448186|nr:hypothetical protein SAMD00019534_018290 [Acytostelium subglobosum LB1]GAM18654.1 hypothetical protein SAMD00019534_018290 [Acytostelium subglobosum LB1]|eukprot:XP_012757874.1 hypothetical protein SAMD00019534_018290 [Acytostelium subglobosum LB1]